MTYRWFLNRRLMRLAQITVCSVFLFSCAPSGPYRTVVNSSDSPRCVSDAAGNVPLKCDHLLTERSKTYDLLFVEFDDQGWLNTADEHFSNGSKKIGGVDAFGNLKNYLDQHENERLLIVTFVHGWKHNASSHDANVKLFRRMLQETAQLQADHHTGRKVVGLYIGWRGNSIDGPDFLSTALTFYDRKGTAHKVSKGAIQEVIAYTSAYERHANAPKPGDTRSSGKWDDPARGCQVVSLYIGHSFGGLILYEAIAPKMIASITASEFSGKIQRFGDIVILINPAIEAARFEPLFRTVERYKGKRYTAPLMVMVPTSADDATGIAFPVGRFFSTLFEKKNSAEQREATLETIGHMEPYITHNLYHRDADKRVTEGDTSSVSSLAILDAASGCDTPTTSPQTAAVAARMPAHGYGKGNILTLRCHRYDNFPVWNVSTDASVMKGHSDLESDALEDFIIALTNDAIITPIDMNGTGGGNAKREITYHCAGPACAASKCP